MSAPFNKFNNFVQDLGAKVHNLSSDTLKIMLSNTLPVATNHVKTDITEISAGNGYSAGGTAVGSVTWSNSSGTSTLAGASVVFTATGTVGPFEYAVLYNATAGSGNLIGWWDYGSALTLASGQTFTFNTVTNFLTLG